MAAAAPAHRSAAGIVAPALLPQPLSQRLDRLALPELAAVDNDEMPLRWRRRVECLQRHDIDPWVPALNSGRHVNARPFGQGHDGLLVIGAATGTAAKPLGFAGNADRVDGIYLDVKQPFD